MGGPRGGPGVDRAGQGKDEEQSCVAREGGSREGRKGVEMAGRRSESSARPAAILTPLICRRKDGASRGGEREWGPTRDLAAPPSIESSG